MNQDHQTIEELLAGHALRSLSPGDAVLADQLLAEHVPSCPICRGLLVDLRSVASELALVPSPLRPPETLLARLHRDLGSRRRRRRPVQLFAVAAGVVLVAGMSGLAVTQGLRASHGEARATALGNRARALGNIMDFVAQPDAKVAPVGPTKEISAPGKALFYLYGRDVPMPAPGMVYRVWLVAGSIPTYVGEFLPEDGFVGLEVPFDPSRYDTLWVCPALAGSPHVAPLPGDVLWRAGA